MPLPTLHAAARAVVDLWPDQPSPLQDLCEAVAILEAVLDAGTERRKAYLEGKAGRKKEANYDLIDAMLGRQDRVAEIAAAAGVSETTVRNRRAQLTRRVVTPAKKTATVTPAKKPKKRDK